MKSYNGLYCASDAQSAFNITTSRRRPILISPGMAFFSLSLSPKSCRGYRAHMGPLRPANRMEVLPRRQVRAIFGLERPGTCPRARFVSRHLHPFVGQDVAHAPLIHTITLRRPDHANAVLTVAHPFYLLYLIVLSFVCTCQIAMHDLIFVKAAKLGV